MRFSQTWRARIPILTSHFPPFLQIDLHLSITTQTNSVVKSGQEEYGRRTRPRRNVQRRNIAPTQAVAYCYWQGPMCRHVVNSFTRSRSWVERCCFNFLLIIVITLDLVCIENCVTVYSFQVLFYFCWLKMEVYITTEFMTYLWEI